MKINFDVKGDVEKQFETLADQLFNTTKLVVNKEEYLFTEIEFYVYNKEHHPDPFAHKNEEQLKSNTWYFHGSGIDITIGNKAEITKDNTYGGILIRGLKKIKAKKTTYIDGPLNILREIFSNINLVNSKQQFGIEESMHEKSVVFKSTRVNLNARGDTNKQNYQKKKYRYLIDLKVEHKYKEKGIVDKNN